MSFLFLSIITTYINLQKQKIWALNMFIRPKSSFATIFIFIIDKTRLIKLLILFIIICREI